MQPEPSYASAEEKRCLAEAYEASQRSHSIRRQLSLLEEEQLEQALAASRLEAMQERPPEDQAALMEALFMSEQEHTRQAQEAAGYDEEERRQLELAMAQSMREAMAEPQGWSDQDEDGAPIMQELSHADTLLVPLSRRYTSVSLRPSRPLPTPPTQIHRRWNSHSGVGSASIPQQRDLAATASPPSSTPLPVSLIHRSSSHSGLGLASTCRQGELPRPPVPSSSHLTVEQVERPSLVVSKSAPPDGLPAPSLRYRHSAILRRQPDLTEAELDLRNRQAQLTEEIAGIRIGFQAVNDALHDGSNFPEFVELSCQPDIRYQTFCVEAPTIQTLIQYLMWFGDCSFVAAPQDLGQVDKPLEARIGFQFYATRGPRSNPCLRLSITLDSPLRMLLRRAVQPSFATELPSTVQLPINLQDLARSLKSIQGAARLCKPSQGALHLLNRQFDQLTLAHGGTLTEAESPDSYARLRHKLRKLRSKRAPEERRPTIDAALPYVRLRERGASLTKRQRDEAQLITPFSLPDLN